MKRRQRIRARRRQRFSPARGDSMNPLERVQRRLHGEEVDRAPNFDIYMTRAAHYVGRPLSEYYLDYRALVEANLAVYDDFDLDIVQTLSDPYREAADMGLEVEFPDDDLPIRKKVLLEGPEDLAKLKRVAAADGPRMSDRLDAVRTLVEKVGRDVVVMGWVEGALALACDIRGDTDLMTDLYDRPEWVEELLELLVEQQIAFAKEQVALGAHMIGLGDAIASLVSPKQYRKFALPYEQRIFAAIKEAGAIPRLHICGDTNHIVSDMAQSGAEIVDLDWMVDLQKAAETFGDDGPAPCGNFDPVEIMLRGTPETVAEATRTCKAAGGPRHFAAAGCEIPDDTPEANMTAHATALQDLGG
jgi:MtaA/CmuA family methyltransferase